MVTRGQFDTPLLRAQGHQAGGGGQQAAIEHVDTHAIARVKRIEYQVATVLADTHRTTRIAGKRPTQFQVQQGWRSSCYVLADIALGFQRKVAPYVQHRVGRYACKVAFHAELR